MNSAVTFKKPLTTAESSNSIFSVNSLMCLPPPLMFLLLERRFWVPEHRQRWPDCCHMDVPMAYGGITWRKKILVAPIVSSDLARRLRHSVRASHRAFRPPCIYGRAVCHYFSELSHYFFAINFLRSWPQR